MLYRRGIGVAALFHGTSLGAEGHDYAAGTIAVEQDYSIDLTSGLTDYGTGSRTVYTLIAAEELGVRPDRIHMQRPDTDTAVESGPTVASRSTMLGGNARGSPPSTCARRWITRRPICSVASCTSWYARRTDEAYVGPERRAGELGRGSRPRPGDGPGALRPGQVDRADHPLGPPCRPRHALHGLSLRGAGRRGRGGHPHR